MNEVSDAVVHYLECSIELISRQYDYTAKNRVASRRSRSLLAVMGMLLFIGPARRSAPQHGSLY